MGLRADRGGPRRADRAKALGGGLPAGALVTGPRLADVLQPGDHGSTFAGGPVVASAALVALAICSDPSLLGSVRALGERLRAGLAELPGVAEVRGRGLMVGVDFAEGVAAVEIARRALLEQRLVINATGPATIRFEPPLVVSEAEIDEAVARTGGAAQMSGVASAKVSVSLAYGQRADAAAATVLRRLLDTVHANMDGALAGEDPEYLHQLRISVRRSRTVQRQLAPVFPPLELPGYRTEFKWLQRATGEARDLDVHVQEFDAMLDARAAGGPR